MPRVKLTARTIQALKPRQQRTDYFDKLLPGFHLRVTPSGVKSYSVLYRHAGRLRRYTIGTHPTLDLAKAREEARAVLQDARLGGDPQGRKKQERAADTFAELAARYIERHAAKKKTGDRDAEYLKRDVLPRWGKVKAKEIRRRDIVALVEKKANDAPVAANRLLSVLSKLFRWAVKCDELDSNPCALVTKPTAETPRSRVLSDAEIRQFWTALDDPALSMNPEILTILRLVLVTAQRPGQICGIEWSELAENWWTIPPVRVKNTRPEKSPQAHRVPLSSLALQILKARPREGRYVFPSPRGAGPIAVSELTRALRDHEHLGLVQFTAHDLRRTASDCMARLGVDGRSRAAVLNHKEGGTTEKHYTVYTFDAEKKTALTKWDRKLRAVIEGKPAEKVVEIR